MAIHPFTDGNGRVGRALLNFVLRQNGYPTLYPDLVHRENYLDAIEEGNKGDYKPIIEFLYEIYLAQHCTIYDETIKKIRSGEAKAFPNNIRLVEEFRQIRIVKGKK